MDTTEEGIDVRLLQVPALIELCHDGNQAACRELDRRGVEPPILEPDPVDLPAPPRELDVTLERSPTPGWLREYAGAMKFEAAMLEGHAMTLIERASCVSRDGRRGDVEFDALVRQTALAGVAAASLRTASSALVSLAGAFDEVTPEMAAADPARHDDQRGDADR